MSNDRQVISYMSPAELIALMNETGIIGVNETGMSDGKPVIHAAVRVVNAETGEQLPGGLPFSVVMFKGPNEPGYSNIAIGTIVPAGELNVALPRDYFNFCNQRFRFSRVFPVDDASFVIQMDLVVKNATREYVKFSFGMWGALFSHVLFELMGRERESLVAAAEAYAQVHTDFAAQIADLPGAADVQPLPVEIVEPVAETVMALEAEAIVPTEVEVAESVEPVLDDVVAPAEEAKAEDATAEVVPIDAANVVETHETAVVAAADVSDAPELSIVAGPAVVEAVAQAEEPADADTVVEVGETKETAAA
jgi:hypothetical protein